jgi:hypothetical protein
LFSEQPDILFENALKYETTIEETIDIAENEILRSDFVDGWDISGKITTANNIIVNEKLFRLGTDKTLNIRVTVE